MAVPSLNFSNGSGLQQSYHHQPPAPLFPYNLSLPQPLFNSNPWVAQCLPPVQYYQQPQYMNTASCRQLPMRGRGKNWHRQNYKRQSQNNFSTGTKDFHCEACECSFRTEFDLNGHISQHRQCVYPGCNFMGINRVLKEHELIHRIPKELLFTSEEEIAKWREERRKMYPTVARVRKKLAEEEAKIERGETAKDEVHRYRKRGGGAYACPAAKRGRGGYSRFQGRPYTQNRRNDKRLPHHSESSDDNTALGQLASSLAKDTGITGCSSSQKTKVPILQNTSGHKATLLEKVKQLLAPEIRQERNKILQCIRHIVKKNFFGIEGSSSDVKTNAEATDGVEGVSPDAYSNNEQSRTTKGEEQTPSSSDAIIDNVCI